MQHDFRNRFEYDYPFIRICDFVLFIFKFSNFAIIKYSYSHVEQRSIFVYLVFVLRSYVVIEIFSFLKYSKIL